MNRLTLSFVTLCLIYTQHGMGANFNDGHIHYNDDVWPYLSVDEVIEYFDESGINRAVVSSTPAHGTEQLYEKYPSRIIPFIKPYRSLKDVNKWHANREILEYIKLKAESGIYRGFGEFHMWIEHLEGSIMPEVMSLSAKHDWAVSAHTDIETIRALAEMQPKVPVIWAHCGFDYPAEQIETLLKTYANTYCELSLYEKLTDQDNNLYPVWKQLLQAMPDRFMVGIDTYKNKRWADLPVHADSIKEWLNQLPDKIAADIARNNIDRLFPVH